MSKSSGCDATPMVLWIEQCFTSPPTQVIWETGLPMGVLMIWLLRDNLSVFFDAVLNGVCMGNRICFKTWVMGVLPSWVGGGVVEPHNSTAGA